ncbi:hypothetical protein [Yinghuangia soli]|uniref:Uncharacterized protein n=1 Tax=Yinghuangia soli TaxID=2908204 RepID=A0AA41PX42_9ACTN|nr:hypothetical protein [Yinghuangia soli]MCF2526955.1 hypothetical protein [Yinghuangia soli]
MGLILFPGDDDLSSPDVEWSYSGFAAFRRQLAAAEGFELAEMWGFGGDRPWSEVTTPLAVFLDRPDDHGGEMTPVECAALLPRLEAISGQWQHDPEVPREHVRGIRQLAVVMHLCVAKDVELLFL